MGALGPERIRFVPANRVPAALECADAGLVAVALDRRPGAQRAGGDEAQALGAPQSMLEAFLVTVVRLAGAEAGTVRALAADGDRLQLVAAFGLPHEALEHEALVDNNCGVCGDALRGDAVQVTEDPARCGKLAADGQRGCAGTVAVPLEFKGQSVGVFTLFFDGVHSLRGEVIHLLRPVGQLFGLALENARLERENLQSSLLHERQTMAGEIHDSLAQSLTFLRMRMPLLRDAIEKNNAERALRYCGEVNDELGSANRRVRELVTHFRAGMDAQGLRRALEQTADTFFERTGIAMDFECPAGDLRLPADREVQVYHVVQEALANVRRHSGARHATLRVERRGNKLVIAVEDDGSGFPPVVLGKGDAKADARASFGLQIMRERAESIGATVSFENRPVGGARVVIRVPTDHAARRRDPALSEAASRG